MKYMGSKNRIAKHILPIILKDRKENQYYVEPFVGGANMIDKVDPLIAPKRFGSDFNEYLPELWKAAESGWMPPYSLTEDEYKHIKNNKDSYPKELVAWVGFAISFGVSGLVGIVRMLKAMIMLHGHTVRQKNNFLI